MVKEEVNEIRVEKAKIKISINSMIIGALFLMLTLMITLGVETFSFLIIAQLILAIPFLFVSTLAYQKMAYSRKEKYWDAFGSFLSVFGNMFLNSIGLITAVFSKNLAYSYFIILITCMIIYTSINIFNDSAG